MEETILFKFIVESQHMAWKVGEIARRMSNPRLLKHPPPGEEVTGNDICYLGPGGSYNVDEVIFCKDLEHGKRHSVGSWYISPERHVFEYVVITTIAIYLLFQFRMKLFRTSVTKNEFSTTTSKLEPIRPDPFIRFLTLVSIVLQMCYKCVGYSGKLYFWVMPCNVYQLICFAQAFWPNLAHEVSVIMAQLCIGYSGLAVVALATPDTADLVLPGEKPYFFISHFVLVFYPYLFMLRGQLSMLPSQRLSSNTKSSLPSQTHQQLSKNSDYYILNVLRYAFNWWSLTCITFALFYFAFVTPLSIMSGLNLNYMLSPPANQDIVVGNNYRLVSCGCVAFVFFAMRFLATATEWTVRYLYSTYDIRRTVIKKGK